MDNICVQRKRNVLALQDKSTAIPPTKLKWKINKYAIIMITGFPVHICTMLETESKSKSNIKPINRLTMEINFN